MEPFDKHGWLRAVQADPTFSDRKFRLAFVICNICADCSKRIDGEPVIRDDGKLICSDCPPWALKAYEYEECPF